MIELERTYLAKVIPIGLADCKQKELLDIYFPKEEAHPHLRLRQKEGRFEITKKNRINPNDASSLVEETISLTQSEFDAISMAEGKRVRKIRHYLEHNGKLLEVDIFQDDLAGLVLIDVEFDTEEEKNCFQMPDFCLMEVTQEDFLAGGMLCGKRYQDIEDNLIKLGYSKILNFLNL
jgi:CYTH domain-containing protein